MGWDVGVVWVRRSGTYRRAPAGSGREQRSDGSGGSETQAQRGCTRDKTVHLVCPCLAPKTRKDTDKELNTKGGF